MKARAITLLGELTHAHGAPGTEQAVAQIVRRELPGYHHEQDKLGSLISRPHPEGEGPVVLVTAHMDEVGFSVQSITPEGFLKVVPLGGWWTHTLLSQRVRVLTRSGEEVIGVITSVPYHFLQKGSRDKVIEMDQVFIDVGADSREEAEDEFGIALGDPIVPDADLVPMKNPDRLLAKAFDNRVGMALLVQTLQNLEGKSLPNRLVGLSTVQEEVGSHGAHTAAARILPDVAIVLEGPPADDGPGFPRDAAQGKLGGGPQIRLSDPTALMNRPLANLVRDAAQEAGIPHQAAVRRFGGTDARELQRFGDGVPCIVIGIPARYIHSHNSLLDINDYLAGLDLVTRLVMELDQAAVDSLTAYG